MDGQVGWIDTNEDALEDFVSQGYYQPETVALESLTFLPPY
jgi:hypothetical protein